jgi:probable HAF family extracellular repeat protein
MLASLHATRLTNKQIRKHSQPPRERTPCLTGKRISTVKSKKFLLCAMTALATTATALGQQAAFDVINLGTPLGGSFAIAAGISPAGYLGGYANLTGDASQHAVLWYINKTKDLGTFGGPNSNLLNQFSGFSETATKDPLGQDWCETGTGLVCLPITVQNGKAVALPLLGGNNGSGFGNNDLGQVAGSSQTTTLDPSCLVGGEPVSPALQTQQAVPVIWTHGRARQLPLFPGDSEGSANAINNLGQATGATGDCVNATAAHAVLWKDGKTINLGSLGGVLYTNPFAINDRTQVTGTADLAGDLTSHAFLWQNGVMTDLGTLPGDYYSVGYSINNRGQVVGQSCDANFNCRAVLWQNGKITDLNTLIPSTSALYLYLAATIDDFGVIVGYASDQTANTSPGFVAIPKFIFGSLDASSSIAHREAAPKVFLPEALRTQIQKNMKKRGARRIRPS